MLAILAFAIEAQTVQLILGVILPLIVGVVTKANASKSVKALVLLILSLIGTTLSGAIGDDGAAVFSQEMLSGIVQTWVVAIATYYGLWKPSGASAVINTKTADFGLGKKKG